MAATDRSSARSPLDAAAYAVPNPYRGRVGRVL